MSIFEDALSLTMRWECGPKFDIKNPDAYTGYVNHPADKGAETKWGIAQNSHPGLDIKNLSWSAAKEIYRIKYWHAAQCDELAGRLAVANFDAAVNHGVKRAVILLQRAVGAKDDGDFGPKTMAAIQQAAPTMTPKQWLAPRRQFFLDIVRKNPTQIVFLNGWLNRCSDLERFLSE